MKEMIIQVRIDKNKIGTIVKKQGFEETISSSLEVIGILQNIIKIEQDKMAENSTTMSNSENGTQKK